MLKSVAGSVSRHLSRVTVTIVRFTTARPLRLPLARSGDACLDKALAAAGLRRGALFTAYRGNARHRKYMAAMMTCFHIDRERACEAFWPELREADALCADCPSVRRCARHLAWGLRGEAARTFCPNADLFDEIARAQAAEQTADSPRRL